MTTISRETESADQALTQPAQESIPGLKTPNDAQRIIRMSLLGADYGGQDDSKNKRINASLIRNMAPLLLIAADYVRQDFTGWTGERIIQEMEELAKRQGARLTEQGLFQKTVREIRDIEPNIPSTTAIPQTVFDEAVIIIQTGRTTGDVLSAGGRVNSDRFESGMDNKVKKADRRDFNRMRLTARNHNLLSDSVPASEKKQPPVVWTRNNP